MVIKTKLIGTLVKSGKIKMPKLCSLHVKFVTASRGKRYPVKNFIQLSGYPVSVNILFGYNTTQNRKKFSKNPSKHPTKHPIFLQVFVIDNGYS